MSEREEVIQQLKDAESITREEFLKLSNTYLPKSRIPTQLHRDVAELLSGITIAERKLILPLSYTDFITGQRHYVYPEDGEEKFLETVTGQKLANLFRDYLKINFNGNDGQPNEQEYREALVDTEPGGEE